MKTTMSRSEVMVVLQAPSLPDAAAVGILGFAPESRKKVRGALGRPPALWGTSQLGGEDPFRRAEPLYAKDTKRLCPASPLLVLCFA